MEEWDDLLLLTGQVNYDHLFVVVSSRKGSISYQTSLDRKSTRLNSSHITRSRMPYSVGKIYPTINKLLLAKYLLICDGRRSKEV